MLLKCSTFNVIRECQNRVNLILSEICDSQMKPILFIQK